MPISPWDLQGILNLTMTSGPQVDFSFNSIAEYKQGIVKYNATQLEVDATVAWDMYVYAATDTWTQVEAYSTNGAAIYRLKFLRFLLPTTIRLSQVGLVSTTIWFR
jgi:hypothetical protein